MTSKLLWCEWFHLFPKYKSHQKFVKNRFWRTSEQSTVHMWGHFLLFVLYLEKRFSYYHRIYFSSGNKQDTITCGPTTLLIQCFTTRLDDTFTVDILVQCSFQSSFSVSVVAWFSLLLILGKPGYVVSWESRVTTLCLLFVALESLAVFWYVHSWLLGCNFFFIKCSSSPNGWLSMFLSLSGSRDSGNHWLT